MKFLDLTLKHPSANIALDEALIESAEAGQSDEEVLRVWESDVPIVVLGRSSNWQREVNVEFCKQASIPIFRRCSGGASIVTSPGCLMYAVLLKYDRHPKLRLLDHAHQFVISMLQQAIRKTGYETEFQGTSDLTLDNQKVSGNSLRCKKHWMLYHGTIICENMNLQLISKCLGSPKREPDYRQGRSHSQFVTSLPVSTSQMSRSLRQVWGCENQLTDWPQSMTHQLVADKYTTDAWNLRI